MIDQLLTDPYLWMRTTCNSIRERLVPQHIPYVRIDMFKKVNDRQVKTPKWMTVCNNSDSKHYKRGWVGTTSLVLCHGPKDSPSNPNKKAGW